MKRKFQIPHSQIPCNILGLDCRIRQGKTCGIWQPQMLHGDLLCSIIVFLVSWHAKSQKQHEFCNYTRFSSFTGFFSFYSCQVDFCVLRLSWIMRSSWASFNDVNLCLFTVTRTAHALPLIAQSRVEGMHLF